MTDQASPKKQNIKNQSDSKKIIIETKADLFNLPTDLLKTTNILDFSGKYFDFIYKRALDLEKVREHKDSINSLFSNQSTEIKKKKMKLSQIEGIPRTITTNNIRPKKKLTKKGALKNPKKNHTNKANTKPNSNEKSKQNKNTFKENNNNPQLKINIPNIENTIPLQILNSNSNTHQNTNPINSRNHYYNDDYMDYYNDNLMDTLPMPYQNQYQNNTFPNVNEFKINKICFEMKYNTRIGENLGIIGSIPELGAWKENKALKMAWNNDNIWKASLFYNNAVAEIFEYKFIFLCNGSVKQWEDGSNRKFSLANIKKLMEPHLKDGNGNVTLRSVSECDLSYDSKDNELTIKCYWNKK